MKLSAISTAGLLLGGAAALKPVETLSSVKTATPTVNTGNHAPMRPIPKRAAQAFLTDASTSTFTQLPTTLTEVSTLLTYSILPETETKTKTLSSATSTETFGDLGPPPWPQSTFTQEPTTRTDTSTFFTYSILPETETKTKTLSSATSTETFANIGLPAVPPTPKTNDANRLGVPQWLRWS
jgi:hypothetical protein